MKKAEQAITHESFPLFINRIEEKGTKLNGLKINRILTNCLNMLFSCFFAVLTVCMLFANIPQATKPAEAFSHIPAVFIKIGNWALDLFPKLNNWLCLLIPLCAIPITGLVTGLIFRWIPIKGKPAKMAEGGLAKERADAAAGFIHNLQIECTLLSDYFTFDIYIAPLIAGLLALALPIISLYLSYAGEEWYVILFSVLGTLISMILLLVVALCVLCFALFGLALAQEWVTSLFYSGFHFKAEREQIAEYIKLLEQEEKEEHKAMVESTEAEAINLLISGKIADAMKTVAKIEDEAKDAYYIKTIAGALVKEQEVSTYIEWLGINAQSINSDTLREFLLSKQQSSAESLTAIAEKEYPKALELFDKKEYDYAITYLQVAKEVDYRDSVALLGLAQYEADNTDRYDQIIENLNHGIEKGIESQKLEVLCLNALDAAKKRLQQEQERIQAQQEAARRAEEAYWLEVGRQMNMTCQYKQGEYCCRYCTIDNFPPKCYYVDRPRDMWMCDKRKS